MSCSYIFDIKESFCRRPYSQKLPGEYCTYEYECKDDRCNENKCPRNNYNDGSCDKHERCDLQQFCHETTKKCTRLKTMNEECVEGDMCAVGFACNDRCVPMFSVKKGDKSKSSAACETFFAINGTCVEGPRLEGKNGYSKEPALCEDKCSYFASGEPFMDTSCVCGMDSDGTQYCNPGLGDINIDDVYLYNV